ncbi:hypothetical protein B0H14DRAFT_3147692 [Mycena olivaceomarginata]|nr:hypothetical protein B0H14DRAFT_3147692 [Mycena olivaceomarginata]
MTLDSSMLPSTHSVFSASSPDLSEIEMSDAFPTTYSFAPLSVVHVQSQSHTEPLAVASYPLSPLKGRAGASFLSTPLRKFVSKLTAKKSAHVHRPGSLLPSPTRRAATVSTAGRSPLRPRTRLTIRDAAFFLPAQASRYGGDDEENEDACEGDAPGHSGFRAPPPTPMDPFNTPPQTPVRSTSFVIRGIGSPQTLSSSSRRRQETRIVRTLGVEAACVAEGVQP